MIIPKTATTIAVMARIRPFFDFCIFSRGHNQCLQFLEQFYSDIKLSRFQFFIVSI